MSDTAVRVSHLSKCFHLEFEQQKKQTFRETVHRRLGRVFREKYRSRVKSELWALKEVSFEVKRGEILGILGANGSGKSTLLKILARVIRPTSGQIELYGRVSSLLEIGTGFHAELTGRENVYLYSSILGMSRKEAERKFDSIIEFSGIQKFVDVPVKYYSSGMYIRLGFSVAIHVEPDILILDEILGAGDLGFQAQCVAKVRQLSQTGTTILLVSHSKLTLEQTCQRVLWLKDGQLQPELPLTQALHQYVHSFETSQAAL